MVICNPTAGAGGGGGGGRADKSMLEYIWTCIDASTVTLAVVLRAPNNLSRRISPSDTTFSQISVYASSDQSLNTTTSIIIIMHNSVDLTVRDKRDASRFSNATVY